MSESHDERRVRLESEYRARIVRKLRAEADRIEAGGPIQCYSVNDELEGELCTITEDEARAELAASGFNYDEQVAKVEAFIGSLYLPCPFCGADGLPCEREHLDHCNTVACSACGAFVEGYTEDEARAAWNRRPFSPDEKPAEPKPRRTLADVVAHPPEGWTAEDRITVVQFSHENAFIAVSKNTNGVVDEWLYPHTDLDTKRSTYRAVADLLDVLAEVSDV